MLNTWWKKGALAGLVVALIITGLVLVPVFADDSSTPTATPTQTTPPTNPFLDKLASQLGITVDQLKTDIKAAESDMIDQALQDGRITQSQADALKQRLEQNNGVSGFGLKGRGCMNGRMLGLGKTSILDQAVSKGIITQGEATSIQNLAKQSILDQAVKYGIITQAQADSITQLQKNAGNSGGFPGRMMGRGFRGF